MTKLNCDMGESFGIYKAGNDEEIMGYRFFVSVVSKQNGVLKLNNKMAEEIYQIILK